jgi:myo-inositol 2-dehydrogenase / D-chiro-inositol 1-dehydrogenase
LASTGAIGGIVSIQSLALTVSSRTRIRGIIRRSSAVELLVAHLSYSFLNPLRWIFGTPLRVAGIANRKPLAAAAAVRAVTIEQAVMTPKHAER